jgi:hypothetical protein
MNQYKRMRDNTKRCAEMQVKATQNYTRSSLGSVSSPMACFQDSCTRGLSSNCRPAAAELYGRKKQQKQQKNKKKGSN